MKQNNQLSEETLLTYAEKIISLCQRKDIQKFDGFFPLVPEIYDEDYGIFRDAKPTDLSDKNVNVSCFVFGLEEGRNARKESQFLRLKSITAKELRKRTGIFAINPYSLDVAFEKIPNQADAFFQFVGGKMKFLDIPNYVTPAFLKQEAFDSVQTLLGIQWNLDNQNYVYLKPDNSPIGFKYPIDSLDQLKELFKLRDIPDGYKRRVALRNWVAKHMRRKPSKPDEFVEVKRHLRGKENFKWFGMSGTIFVNE